jgi:hypothetical protein
MWIDECASLSPSPYRSALPRVAPVQASALGFRCVNELLDFDIVVHSITVGKADARREA